MVQIMQQRIQKKMATEDNQIVTQITCMLPKMNIEPAVFEKLADLVCRKYSVSAARISIAIVDDSEITRLNKEYLKHNETTDVISFDLSDDSDDQRSFEIIVNAEMADRQGKSRGHSVEAELALYITHGFLHNLGFDDDLPHKAKKMHQAEDEILQKAGFGIVYDSQSNQD